MSDYKIDLSNIKMHWWKFFNLMCGLSNSELGDCCILNRIRNLRNFDTSKIKDVREREKIEKAKERVALKSNSYELTPEEIANIEEFERLTGMS